MDPINKQILSLKDEGKSLRQIASEVGMSHAGVRKRLNRLPDPNTVRVQANLYGFEIKFPVAKRCVNNAISELNSVLRELALENTSKRVIVDAGNWEFIRTPQ